MTLDAKQESSGQPTQAACAHLHIEWTTETVDEQRRIMRGWWECTACHFPFEPAGRSAALEQENERVRDALEQIRNGRKPQVCEEYMECDHDGCRASYEAFAIADKALEGATK